MFCLVLVSCNVDVGKLGVDSLRVKKTRPMSQCEMKVNSVLKEEVALTAKADVSFQDCLPEDVQITAKTTIGKPTFQRVRTIHFYRNSEIFLPYLDILCLL